MTTISLQVPGNTKEYQEIFLSFIVNYSVQELKEIQERNNLYKKLSKIEKEDETKSMKLDESLEYLDIFFGK